MKLRSVLIALLMIFSLGLKASDSMSGAQAMFIYNFLHHVKWPDEGSSKNFVIGVYGHSETYNALVTYTKDRRIGMRTIVVKRIETEQEAADCQLVFVPYGKSGKIPAIKKAIGNKPVLIVSEKSGTTDEGSGIEFVLDGNKLKFHVDQDNIRNQQLVVSKALVDMSTN